MHSFTDADIEYFISPTSTIDIAIIPNSPTKRIVSLELTLEELRALKMMLSEAEIEAIDDIISKTTPTHANAN